MLDLRIRKGVERGAPFEIQVNGQRLPAYEGETIAAAFAAAGLKVTCRTTNTGEPRGIYCGIGVCYGCRMVVNGVPNTRICQTVATPGCIVETQIGTGPWQVET